LNDVIEVLNKVYCDKFSTSAGLKNPKDPNTMGKGNEAKMRIDISYISPNHVSVRPGNRGSNVLVSVALLDEHVRLISVGSGNVSVPARLLSD